jgi:hypothetical protein
MSRALRRIGRIPAAPLTRYIDRRFHDVHVHLDQLGDAVGALAARLDALEERPTESLLPVEELMVLVHEDLRRLKGEVG